LTARDGGNAGNAGAIVSAADIVESKLIPFLTCCKLAFFICAVGVDENPRYGLTTNEGWGLS